MRILETGDSSLFPSDLVREQDFILRVRRFQRLGTAHFIANLALTSLAPLANSTRSLEAAQDKLREFAKVTRGFFTDMSNGDVFISWEGNADTRTIISRLSDLLPPETTKAGDGKGWISLFTLPADYTKLRERVNYYVDIARTQSKIDANGKPSRILQSEAARGPLTAWNVDQIGKLLGDIDLSRYIRIQPIYRRKGEHSWESVSEEFFISFEELKRERFPHVDLSASEHLFLALCETLDQQFLSDLCWHRDLIEGRNVNLNLSISSVVGNVFTQFAHGIPHGQRARICFEIHRGDLFQDFTRTMGVLDTLKKEGFHVAIDGITPDMLRCLDVTALGADFIKINVSRDRAALVSESAVLKKMALIPPEKLVFFRCDNNQALEAGVKLGITLFQGWLIDDDAHPHPEKTKK
ncbi:MAG: EAL domain-containing protein [Bdellovibrionales bacterium]